MRSAVTGWPPCATRSGSSCRSGWCSGSSPSFSGGRPSSRARATSSWPGTAGRPSRHWPTRGPAFPLVGVWQRWDACWYTKIATYGYEAGTNSVNFWPLFPLLTGIAGRILLSSMALGGLIVSAVAYVAAMTGLRRLVAVDIDDDTAVATVIAISIFPTAFFFFARSRNPSSWPCRCGRSWAPGGAGGSWWGSPGPSPR